MVEYLFDLIEGEIVERTFIADSLTWINSVSNYFRSRSSVLPTVSEEKFENIVFHATSKDNAASKPNMFISNKYTKLLEDISGCRELLIGKGVDVSDFDKSWRYANVFMFASVMLIVWRCVFNCN